jgi:hypothetical protein
VRSADPTETAAYQDGAMNADDPDELLLVYLVPVVKAKK